MQSISSRDRAFGLPWQFRGGALTLAGVVAAAVVFFLLRDGYVIFLYRYPNAAWSVFVTTALLAACFYRVEYRKVPGTLATITRGCIAAVVFSLIVEPPVLTLVNPEKAGAAAYVEWAWIPAIFLGALAVWRMPSFAIPAAFFAVSIRYLTDDVSLFHISLLDIRYVVETAMFGAGMLCLIWLADSMADRARQGERPTSGGLAAFWDHNRTGIINASAMIAIGFHLGNYFWSGVAKVALDGGPLSWVLENPTHHGIINAIERGSLPSAAWPWVTDLLFRGLGAIAVPLNALVLVAQLASILLVFRIRWLLWLTYFYDVFHVGIYVFGGLLFWPWIWNNLAIVAALRRYRDHAIGLTPMLAAVAGILLGGSSKLGDAARLAWYEVTDIRSVQIEAETADRRRVTVPPSFFMSHSYSVTQGALGVAMGPDHYGHTLWGSTHSYDRFRRDGTCPSPGAGRPDGAMTARERAQLKRVRRFLVAHHAKMLGRAKRLGHLNFYLRGHHHPSNPALFRDFNALDLKDVNRYLVVTESVCLRLENGELKRTVVNRTEYPIDVR